MQLLVEDKMTTEFTFIEKSSQLVSNALRQAMAAVLGLHGLSAGWFSARAA